MNFRNVHSLASNEVLSAARFLADWHTPVSSLFSKIVLCLYSLRHLHNLSAFAQQA